MRILVIGGAGTVGKRITSYLPAKHQIITAGRSSGDIKVVELKRGLRINVVSPGLVEDSAAADGHLFPGMPAVPMNRLVEAHASSIEGSGTGEIIRVYE